MFARSRARAAGLAQFECLQGASARSVTSARPLQDPSQHEGVCEELTLFHCARFWSLALGKCWNYWKRAQSGKPVPCGVRVRTGLAFHSASQSAGGYRARTLRYLHSGRAHVVRRLAWLRPPTLPAFLQDRPVPSERARPPPHGSERSSPMIYQQPKVKEQWQRVKRAQG